MKALVSGLFLFLICTRALYAADAVSGVTPSADGLIGQWRGLWSSQRSSGEMEIDIQTVESGRIAGRVKASYAGRTNCSTSWEELVGARSGEQLVANYDLGGSCGKVSATFSFDTATTTDGTWSNQYGSNGTLRLTKQ